MHFLANAAAFTALSEPDFLLIGSVEGGRLSKYISTAELLR